MLREPRGYPAANCNLILPPTRPEADAGYVIMEQVEYPGMSGTNTMCVVTTLLETGMLPMIEPVTNLTLESPAGLIRVRADCAGGKVRGVTFRNVASFATHLDAAVEVPQLGTVTVDVAYGGMFYVIADAEPFGLRLTPDEGRDIVRISEMIKAATAEQLPVVHPEQPGFAGVTIAELTGPGARSGKHEPERGDRLDRHARLGPTRRPGPGRSTARHAVPARRPGWPSCTPRAGWGSTSPSATRASSGRCSRDGSSRRRRSGSTGPSSRRSRAARGSPASPATSSIPTDPFPDGFTVGDIW